MTDETTPDPVETFNALYEADEPVVTRRERVMGISGLTTSALVALMVILPSPYAIGGPGPTYDTLSTTDDGALVTISGAETYEPSGELRLTTVSVQDAGSTFMTMGSVLRGYLSGSQYTTPRELVFGSTEEDAEEAEQESAEQWVTSQEAATVAALEALGTEVSATLTVAQVLSGSDASGKLEEGDVILAVDGEDLDGFTDLADAIAGHAVGDELTVTVDRDGEEQDVTFALVDDGTGSPVMGILVDPEFDLPIDVEVAIDTVGGPSAGLMFTLGIMDLLTEDDELNGALVAGTGTISSTGQVGAIGGIDLKMLGAQRDGAEWFLAPVDNCDEVVGHIPDGLSVVAVEDIDDAYDAIVAIGAGQTDDLPTCEAVAG
ncbi:YlbL family protein [Demequina salsinemoris]|uniref:YlbL family protein n=1 Tax=Demequina salsinemoris TaxID=577470 RepID=UPI001EED8F1A|nr:PDZ domain-containing protein [Demequina salsinemoris]